MRAFVKRALFAAGVAWLLHRVRNRRALTVVMFHRVLRPGDPRATGANPTYTVTVDEFDACLALFTRWYTVIDLAAIERATLGQRLPVCPLLITFDDGWQDNFEYALPLLATRRIPAVLFVATGHIGQREGFWQERVFAAARHAGETDEAAAAKVDALAREPESRRAEVLAALREPGLPRQMADASELAQMQAQGVAIGGHGDTHTPLTDVVDPGAELAACRSALRAWGLGGTAPALSFPHGRFSPALIRKAREAGFNLCFTSDPCLTPTGRLTDPRGIGRVSIDLKHLRRAGGFDLPALAFSLLTRPHRGRA